MRYILTTPAKIKKCAWFIALCLCLGASFASADLVMPVMPAPTDATVYWRLTSIEQTPEVRATGGYSIHYDVQGLELDLGDGLLTESLLAAEGASQGITLVAEKNGQTIMSHSYSWTPLPIFIEPGQTYAIDMSGTQTTSVNTPNSLFGAYIQGEIVGRISAGAYTGHADAVSFEISDQAGVYRDGSLVVSFILRDVNDMFRDRIAFTYTMEEGIKPTPTPVPGFDPVKMTGEEDVPAHYVPVESKDGLFSVITAPDEYRAYGSMNGGAPTFYPADEAGEVVMNERPADAEKDFDAHVKGFKHAKAETLPEHYDVIDEDGVYGFTSRDGEEITRAHGYMDGEGPAFFPIAEDGAVAGDAKPIDPEKDFDKYIKGFGAVTPDASALVSYYHKIKDSLFSFIGRDGETQMRAYGRMDGTDPAYYPADEDGHVENDAEAVNPQDDFEAYIKGFDATVPEEVPGHYETISDSIYAIEDREGNKVYRAHGIKDGNEPAFYPSDEEGTVDEAAEAVTPEQDFETHIAGFVPQAAPAVLPNFYQETESPDVWIFTDKNDQPQYRVYGELHRGEAAFYPADAEGNVSNDALPVNEASDRTLLPLPPFDVSEPADKPVHYTPVEGKEGVYTFSDVDGNPVYRIYGSFDGNPPDFYPADENGNPVDSETPIDPTAEYTEHFGTFESAVPEEVPSHYAPVKGKDSLFQYTDKKNQPVYRVYGSVDGKEGFFPADAEGNIISGASADPDEDALQTATPLTNAIVTQTPADPTATALVRVSDGETGWRDPSVPLPTTLESDVKPTEAATPEATVLASELSTPGTTPEATVLESTVQPEGDATAEPAVVESDVATPAPTEAAEEKTPASFPWWLIVVAAILIIAVIFYFATKGKKKA